MQPCSHARLHICAWQLAGEFVGSSPSGTMSRHDDIRADCDQLRDCTRDNCLEETSSKMKAPNKCMHFLYSSQALRVSSAH